MNSEKIYELVIMQRFSPVRRFILKIDRNLAPETGIQLSHDQVKDLKESTPPHWWAGTSSNVIALLQESPYQDIFVVED